MRRFVLAVTAAALLLAALPPSFARADGTEPGGATTSAGGSSTSVEGAEARAEIEGTLVQMRATSARVRDDLRRTRLRGTRPQVLCVDAALSKADVAVRRARETSDEALAAYARGEVERARASRRRLAEIRESQRVAAMESAWCAPATDGAAKAARPSVTTVKLDATGAATPTR